MAQTSYKTQMDAGREGLPVDNDEGVLSAINQAPQAAQVTELNVSDVNADTVYILNIGGVNIELDTNELDTVDVDSFVEYAHQVIQEDPLVGATIESDPDTTNDKVVLTERNPGHGGFEVVVSQDGPGHLTTTEVQTSGEADPVPFGRLVVYDGESNEGARLARLAKASAFTAQEETLEVSYSAGESYSVEVVVEGRSYEADVDADTDAATTAQAIADTMNDLLPGDTVDVTNNAGTLTFQADIAGQGFDLGYGSSGTGAFTHTVVEGGAGTSVNERALGLSRKVDTVEKPRGAARAEYPPNDSMSVQYEGRMYVDTEDSVDPMNDDVYVRLEADGDLDKLGGLRASDSAGCVRLEDARWDGTTQNGRAIVEVDFR